MNRQHALSALGSGLLAGSVPAAARASTTLRVATLPIDGTALPYYAKELNYFQGAGIDLTIQDISNGAAIAAAVLSNSVDIGSSEITALAAAHARGLPVVIIAPCGLHVTGGLSTQLMVRKDSPLNTATDLTGKVIGVTGLANIAQYAPMLWIDKNGGNSTSVKFLEVPLPQLPSALEQGRVDAAWLTEPFIHASLGFARTFATCFDAVAPRWDLGVWFTSRQWAMSHRDLVDAYRTAMTKAAVWANANQDKSAEILAKISNRDPDALRKTYRTVYATALEASQIQPVIDLAARYGAIAAPFPAQEIMYTA